MDVFDSVEGLYGFDGYWVCASRSGSSVEELVSPEVWCGKVELDLFS